MKRAVLILSAIAVFVLSFALPAGAQDREGDDGGIPAYSVARLKVLAGSVWVRLADVGEWQEYPNNAPLPPRSRISVPESSEAELQFHGSQFVLLTSGTDLEVRDAQEGKSTFRLRAGEIRYDLPDDDFAPVTVRIPGGGRTHFPEPGRYWLTVTDVDETRLVVRRGRATVTQDGDDFRLREGEVATIGGDVTIDRYRGGGTDYTASTPPPESARHGDVPPMVASELSDYGEWVTVPTYGNVWRPRVAAGWSPYVYGRWVWISPYGWTWVSNEPWGWYPYRCGYWLSDPVFGWFWTPYNSFVSVNFFFGSFRHFHHNLFFHSARVRFVPEGRDVRWVPLRPGERFRRAEFRPGDSRLARWNRPLEPGRVFTRAGDNRREWRDWSAVRTERQTAVRQAIQANPRPDNRGIRPERTMGRPAVVERGRAGGSTAPVVRTPPSRTMERPARVPRDRSVTQGKADRERNVGRGGVAPREGRTLTRPPEAVPRLQSRPPADAGERVREERGPAVRAPNGGDAGRDPRGERSIGGGRGGGGERGGGGDRGGGGGRGDFGGGRGDGGRSR